MIAGRCACGMVMEWVARKPEDHLRCNGLRWCGVCGEAARHDGHCTFCERRRSREWSERQRVGATPAYAREKERKREKYRNDPAWRAQVLAKQKQKRESDPAYRERANALRKAWRAKQKPYGPPVGCGCGCGKVFLAYDQHGRPRTYWPGHYRRRKAA